MTAACRGEIQRRGCAHPIYPDEARAMQNIAATLRAKYPAAQSIDGWSLPFRTLPAEFLSGNEGRRRAYPENIGTRTGPAVSAVTMDAQDHRRRENHPASDCLRLHIILAQGAGAELEKLNARQHLMHIDAEYENLTAQAATRRVHQAVKVGRVTPCAPPHLLAAKERKEHKGGARLLTSRLTLNP